MKRIGLYFIGMMALVPCGQALESVAQSDVGSGSAVAGGMGALQTQIDSLRANQTAANIIIQNLQQKNDTLTKIINQIAEVTYGPGGNGTGGSGGGSSTSIVSSTEVSATIRLTKGSWCGNLMWNDDMRNIISHTPCNGEALYSAGRSGRWSNYVTHCPKGYTFTTVGYDTSTLPAFTQGPSDTGNSASQPNGTTTTTNYVMGSCLRSS